MSLAQENKTKALLLLIFLAFIWGSSFILMKKAMFSSDGVKLLSHTQVASLRIIFATASLLPFIYSRRKHLFSPYWKYIAAVGIFGSGIPAFLFTAAQQEISSSLAGMLNSLTPLFTLIFAVFLFRQQPQKSSVVGLFIGFLGAIGIGFFSIDFSGGADNMKLIPMLMVVIATICYALGLNIIKSKLKPLHPMTITSLSFIFVLPPALVILLSGDFTERISSPEVYPAIGYTAILGIAGTSMAILVFNYVIKISTAIFASSVTYLIPIVAVGWGLIFGEAISFYQIISMGVILIGIYLINKR